MELHTFDPKIVSVVDKQSILPAYYQLAKILEYKIRLGSYKSGDALPTEAELSKEHSISRMTVRRALSELASMGLVVALKGKGTYVADSSFSNPVFELNNFFDDIKQKGLQPKSRLIEARINKAEDVIAEKLQVKKNTKYLYFRSIIFAEDEPLVYDIKHILYTKQKPILEELYNYSLHSLVLASNDSQPLKSLNILQATSLREDEAILLDAKINSPAFLVEQTLYDSNSKPIGWGKSFYRGDRYQLTSYGGIW